MTIIIGLLLIILVVLFRRPLNRALGWHGLRLAEDRRQSSTTQQLIEEGAEEL